MLAAHTASFLSLINTALEDISRGVASPHHLHNVRCGIENILSLLKYNNEVVEKADQLLCRAYDYVTPWSWRCSSCCCCRTCGCCCIVGTSGNLLGTRSE